MVKYAIMLDLDSDILSKIYNSSNENAYLKIQATLEKYGFSRHGSVYFGDSTVDAVKTVMAARKLSVQYTWFAPSVKDIRMLRIEDDNDLMLAIRD